jgi:hypothetical protein
MHIILLGDQKTLRVVASQFWVVGNCITHINTLLYSYPETLFDIIWDQTTGKKIIYPSMKAKGESYLHIPYIFKQYQKLNSAPSWQEKNL